MNILIIGSGGREHALAWKAAQSPLADAVYVAPGNAGTSLEPGVENVDLGVDDIPALLEFARDREIGLTIVGPEQPLVAGVVDAFHEAGLPCFGPTKLAAQLEGSKAFAKDFLARHNIPTAAYATFSDVDEACAYVREQGAPIVIKADGLAAGKGVILADTEAEAIAASRICSVAMSLARPATGWSSRSFWSARRPALSSWPMAHIACRWRPRRITRHATTATRVRIPAAWGPIHRRLSSRPRSMSVPCEEVILPTIAGMAEEGCAFTGFLYAGLMIAADGTPKVLEYNVRFGDPETQPILCRLQSDLVELCLAALQGGLAAVEARWDERPALGVVMAAGGYPEAYRRGDAITGLDTAAEGGCKVFHAGTRMQGDAVVTSGGRVLCVCAMGDDIAAAQQQAYRCVGAIDWQDVYYRTDIGYRAIARSG